MYLNEQQKAALEALRQALTAAGAAINSGGMSALDELQGDLAYPDSINDVIDALDAALGVHHA